MVVDADIGENASGVLYALGGIGGGLTLYLDKGHLVYEYNMMMIERYIGRSPMRWRPASTRSPSTRRSPSLAGPPTS